ncbi:MAG TPA: DinB family protein [Chloroflexota bacterium]|nr:DinB family protein [Chloroflexota bacterium]
MRYALLISGFVCAALILATRGPAAQSVSLQRDALDDWTSLKSTMMKISEAMPADKYGYKSTAPQRTFGEQVLHVAEANVIQMGRLGFKAAAPAINMKATSKAEILKALSDSFDYGTAALKEQTDQTMLQMADASRFSFGGPSTRARVVFFVIGHTWDIYGQMAVYLRLNGIVPPASQRP